MADKPIINIVATQCQPTDDEKFNKWYNEVHIPMLLKNKKLKAVTRYKVIGKPSDLPRYIAIYKFDSLKDFEEFGKGPEMDEARKDMQATWGQKVEVTSRVQYEVIKEWKK
jgi:uncharacterized protein (TIGR02118 family)